VQSAAEAPPKLSPPYFYPQDFTGSVFVGRGQELADLHNLLGRSGRVAIAAVGMGGIGKTTLARRYVHQHRADYPGGIWWVAAAEVLTQVLDYAARSVGPEKLPMDWDEARIVRHCFARWEACYPGRKLLVLDDVGAYSAVRGFVEQGAFQVLITTRVQMRRPMECLALGVLEPPDALELLRQLGVDEAQLETEAAGALCEWLGYLPLGIELVGRYLAETGRAIGTVLARLEQKALAARPIATVFDEMDYGRNVQSAIELSWQQLDEAAQRVALLLGLFALAPIEADWVVAALPDVDADEVRDCLDLELVKRSLVEGEETARGRHYQLHSLVRAFLQAKGEAAEWAAQAAGLQQGFAQAMTDVARTIEPTVVVSEQARVRGAVPHMEEVAAQWTGELEGIDKIWCCIGLARFYGSLNLWIEAERCYQKSLEVAKAELGDRHPDTATSLNNLAALYYSQGRYGEAEPLYVQALEICKAELGARHPDTATSLNNLAALYRSQGRYSEAEPLLVQALEICKAELGARHPDTATSLNNLAALYESQGRYSEAEPLLVQALEIRKAELGARHPSTASSLNNLAELYRSQGRYSEAKPLYVQALEIRKSELGDRHPDTASSLNNLALLYESQGRYGEAEPLYVQTLEIRKSELGDRHPDTASSLNNLAGLYRSQGRYGEAEPLYVQALEIRKSELGDRHPDTASSLNNLAGLYRSQGRYGEAEPLYVQALEICKSELGDRHPSTAQGLNNLAGLYESQGRYGEAEPLYVQALEIRKAELGDRHPSTATSLNNLAALYKSQGRYSEAEPLYVQALEIRKAELGDRHPSTATSLNNLAMLYYSTNRLPQAAETMSDVVNIFEDLLGLEHPNTLTVKANLKAIRQAIK